MKLSIVTKITIKTNKNIIIEKIIEYIFNELVNEIQVFMNNKVYIRFNNKPIFAIENSLMFNKKKMLLLRKTFKNKGVGNIFILFPFENHKMMNITQKFNAIYDSPKYEFFENSRIKFNISYYCMNKLLK